MKKILRTIPLFLLFLTLLTTTVFAAGGLTAERTSDGMQISASAMLNIDGTILCAVYDADGRMVSIVEVDDPTGFVVPCDADAVRMVNVFAFAEDSFLPVTANLTATLEAPGEEPHIHTWDEGEVLDPPSCGSTGVMRYTCTDPTCFEVYDEDIPTIDHVWTPWRRVNANEHIRTCQVYDHHIETAPHNWKLTEVYYQPTYTSEGYGVYTCTVCSAGKQGTIPMLERKEVWFTYDADMGEYMLNWLKEADLPTGHSYFINGQYCGFVQQNYHPTRSCAVSFSDLFMYSEPTAGDIVIESGRSNGMGERTLIYTAEDAIQIVEGEEANFTLTGQTDGTYLIGADYDLTGMNVEVKLMHDSGEELFRENYDTPYLNIYPWDGCTMELAATVYTISEDTGTLIISTTPTEAVTEFIRPETPMGRTVTTAEELQEALTIGGRVTIGADITADYMDIYGGEPTTLVLNGHTLTIDSFRFINGKEMTIDGTVEGSAIIGELVVSPADKLTVLGGSYGQIYGNWINTITMEDAELTSDSVTFNTYDCFDIRLTDCTITSTGNDAMGINRGDQLTVEGGTITTSADSDDRFTRYEALFVSGVETVRLFNVEASSVSGSAAELSPAYAYITNGEPFTGSSVYVRGGSYTSLSTDLAAAALQVMDYENVDIGGVTDSGSDPEDLQIASACHGIELAEISGSITLSDITGKDIEGGSGYYNVFYIHNLDQGGDVAITRLTGTGGRADTLRVENRSALTITDCNFTAYSGLATAPMSIEKVDTVTIRDTEGTNGYYGLYIFDCMDADLSNLMISGTVFGLNTSNVTDLYADDCKFYGGETRCWETGSYTLHGCLIDGDLVATANLGTSVSVNLTGGTLVTGKCITDQYSTIG